MPLPLSLAAVPLSYLSRIAEPWAYLLLGATSIITEEIAPIVGGFAAHEGHLGLTQVVVACAVGTWGATTGLYFLGRWRSAWVRRREGAEPGVLARALTMVQRRPWHSALVVRFAIGARVILPLACGAAHVPTATYLIGTGISSVAWAVLFGIVGWAFGEAAVRFLGHVKRYEDVIAVGMAIGIALAFYLARRRAKRRAAHVISGE